jgi:hypothetical protein
MKDQKARNCLTCKWAQWSRTKKGTLSAAGGGSCTFKYVPAPLPVAMYCLGGGCRLYGGHIRRSDLRDCPCYEPMEAKAEEVKP